jgi:NAD-dependent dihydropyrimidine dehydrogenase PreA subunit
VTTPQPTPECKEAGQLVPLIDRNHCEGKADCVRVCPYDVFELRVLSQQERAQLSFVGKIKAFVHGGKQAFAVREDQCHACGLCVRECPERAIKLVRARP